MKPAILILLASTVLFSRSGCGGPTTPTPSPSPTPSIFPRGVPNATALENLPLVESLERAQGRLTTRLVWVSTWTKLDGRMLDGITWVYRFGEIVGTRSNLFEWTVDPDGAVSHHYGEVTNDIGRIIRVEYDELRPLTIDSPEMVRLGLQYGGQRFLDRYPDANVLVEVIYRYLGGEPVCYLIVRASPSVGCSVPIYIHAHTGALMARDLSCLNR